MKKRTIHVFPILLVFLLLLVGCRNSGQEPRAEWDQEAGILTVDGVRYRELQLRKRLLKNPDFQKMFRNV